MSSPYLKVAFVCALFATVTGLAYYSLSPAEPTNVLHHNSTGQYAVPPPLPPTSPPPPPPPVPATGEEEYFKVVEKMPLFPGCDHVDDYKTQKSCADKLLFEYVYGNIKYPEKARKEGIEGMAVVSFKVNALGKVFDEKILRNPGAGTGEEALRVVKTMRENNIRWTPGSNRGRVVTVQFNLPVRFKLQ